MNRYLRSILLIAAALLAVVAPLDAQRPAGAADNVILMTLDGARVQEMFGGLDLDILRSTLKEGQIVETQPVYRRFWADTVEARREKLMPFFWKTLMAEHGWIAGNAALGSTVRLTNRHRFSYPGYSELLVGEANDDVIKSNDPIRNPNRTVLEIARERLQLPPERVATFGSWAHFNAMAEHTEGATYINAGPESMPPLHGLDRLNAWQVEAAPPWDDVRFDVFTFRAAMAHLASARPRLLYLAFDETDDWAHSGRYDRLLDAYARTDSYLNELWTWLESQPDYRGRTHLVITTDHGRGRTQADWRNHGEKTAGAEEVWIAFASPAMSRRGEWKNQPRLFTDQVAATLAGWLGIDWQQVRPHAGKPIQ
jgi:hypothetical protein